ncbi:Bacterial protein of unknown function (HtrL_YibB) family protein [Brugia pahangi]
MVHSTLEDEWKDEAYIPEVMESLLSKNKLIKDEKYMRQPDESINHFGRWLFGIISVAITLAFMFFFLSNIYKRVSVKRSDPLIHSSSDFIDSYDQEESNDHIFDIQQITDNADNAQQQFDVINENSAISQYDNDKSQKSIKDDDITEAVQQIKLDDEVFTKFLKPLILSDISKTTLTDEKFFNLPTFTVTPTSIPTTSKITSATDKKYKFNAYIKTSLRPKLFIVNASLSNLLNATKTNLHSNSNTTNGTLLFDKNSVTPIIRKFSNFSKINSQFTKSKEKNDSNKITITTTKFTAHLRITTISTVNVTIALSRMQQEDNRMISNEENENDYEYEDILYLRPPVATTITTTTMTTTTATTTTTTITFHQFSPISQSHDHHDHPHHHHHHHHYHHHQHYHQHHQCTHDDRQSPVIVTALFDIGRGKWPRYTRTYEQYMNYLKHLLKLRNCLIIYTDASGAKFVRQMRNADNTKIFEMSMHDLPLYRYREEMEGIIRREQQNWQFGPKMRYHPEANSADYNIIVNSKPYFLYNATQNAQFQASDRMFAWIDAGYGHGREGIIPSHCHWRPELQRDRMTVIKLTPAHDKVSRYSITDLYRVDWVVLSGGFIAGDSHTINRFYRFYQKSFMELLDSGRIDDDQTVLTLMLKHYATLFNPISSNGDWYAVFRLFPCKNS